MNKLCKAFVASVFLCFALPSIASTDEAAVQGVFMEYRAALLQGNGMHAADLLSKSTYDYYDEMRTVALYGDAAAVKQQSLINQMTILLLRLRMKASDLETMTGREIIAHFVNEGLISKNSVLSIRPGKVLTEGNVASMHILVEGRDAGPAFQFAREGGAWRIDMVPTIMATNVVLKMQAQKMGMPDAAFLDTVLESVVGRKIKESDWVAPRVRMFQ